MSESHPSIIETRRDQILPQLDATDIERARRFGEVREFAAGETLAAIGEVGIGLAIILSGAVDVYRFDANFGQDTVFDNGPPSGDPQPPFQTGGYGHDRIEFTAYELGDFNIAEPGALIGFAGPRVIEQTIRQKLPKGFQRSEFLLEHGMLDAVVDRRNLRDFLIRILTFNGPDK